MAITNPELIKYRIETIVANGLVEHRSGEDKISSIWWPGAKIGSGGFGTVSCQKSEGGKVRAVKCIQRNSLSEKALSQELLALVRMKGRDDVFLDFFGWYEKGEEIFIAMEYVRYGDLSKYIKDEDKARAGAREITRQILKGLVILHGEGICHRDLKPQNVLIASLNPLRVKIADFGASKQAVDTELRTRIGTNGYSAPEIGVLFPKLQVFSNALDIWSLGSMVHEILTSKIPFLDLAEDGLSEMISGVDPEPAPHAIDMITLHNYCQHKISFPTGILESCEVGKEAVDFVKELMSADPGSRPVAVKALQHVWLMEEGGKEDWYQVLTRELLSLGVEVSLGEDEKETLLRNPCKTDIMKLFSVREGFSDLLEQAVAKGCHSVISIMLESPESKAVSKPRKAKIFQKAVENRQIDTVKILLANNLEIDSRVDGDTVLQNVVLRGDIEWAEILLKAGADVNAKGSPQSDRTALQLAAGAGNIDMVSLLLEHKANICATVEHSENGRVAIQAASEGGHIDIVRLLLSKGADINTKACPYDGRTALQAAAEYGHVDLVTYLLGSGAEVNAEACANNGRTALQAACKNGHIEVVNLLLEHGADVNAEPCVNNGRTALQAACENGHIKVADLLLESRANVNAAASSKNGRTALQGASERGYSDLVKILLDNGANIDAEACSEGGVTALAAAAEAEHFEVFEMLIERREALQVQKKVLQAQKEEERRVQNEVLQTQRAREATMALHTAAKSGNINFVKLLLRTGVRSDRSAVQAAAQGGNIDIVKLLLDGLNVNADDEEAQQPLQVAAAGGYLEIVKLLVEKGEDVNNYPLAISNRQKPLQAAAGGGHIQVAKYLLENRAVINDSMLWDNGRTALQASSEGGHIGMVKFLIDNGADVNCPKAMYGGRSALQAAAEKGHIDIVRYLLVNGANVNEPRASYGGQTALKGAVLCSNSEIVKLLLEHGAEVNAEDSYDPQHRSALQTATERGDIGMVKLLLDNDAIIDRRQLELYAAGPVLTATQRLSRPQESIDLLQLLLESGGKADEYHEQTTPLREAARIGRCDAVQLLLKHGAGVNVARFGDNSTAVELAAEGGHADIVRILLEKGGGVNPLYKNGGVVNPLYMPSCGTPTALQLAARGGHTDTVKLLLDGGMDANVTQQNDGGAPALFVAATGGHTDVMKLLINSNADVNARSFGSSGRTVLQEGVSSGRMTVIRLLLENRADVNSPPDNYRAKRRVKP